MHFYTVLPELNPRYRVMSSLLLCSAKGVRVGNLQVILVVEDDHLIQSVVEETLTDGGFEIVIASSGQSALICSTAQKLNIRRLSPTSISDQARSTAGKSPDMPAKSTPAFPSSTWGVQGRSEQHHVLTKPFAPAQLVTAISQLLNSQSPPD